MQTLCIACNPPTNWATDKEYKDHLVTFHGTDSPDEALKMERLKKANSPKLPLGVPPEAAPTAEFTKTMQEIERAKVSQVTPPPIPASIVPPKIEPIRLTYKYEGQHSCGNKVNTLELDANGKHFVIAYCLICQTQVEIREVANLSKKNINDTVLVAESIEIEKSDKKEAVKIIKKEPNNLRKNMKEVKNG